MATARMERHPRSAGEAARDRIKAYMQLRIAAGLPSPVVDEISRDTGISKTTVRHHVKWLREAGEVELQANKRLVLRHEVVLLDRGGS